MTVVVKLLLHMYNVPAAVVGQADQDDRRPKSAKKNDKQKVKEDKARKVKEKEERKKEKREGTSVLCSSYFRYVASEMFLYS